MELPNELKDIEWAQKYLSELEKMSDQELFEETFQAQVPDDYVGGWTIRGWWISELTKLCLHERFFSRPMA